MMRKVSIAALALVGVVVATGLSLLPASPLERLQRQPPVLADDRTGVPTATPSQVRTMTQPASPAPAAIRQRRVITYPEAGNQQYSVLPGHTTTIGSSGKLRRFQLLVESGIKGIDRNALAAFVRATYGAPQGWASQGLWRFRQVGPGEAYDFQLMLVTPATRDAICGGGYDRYTSCRIGDRVVLNVARWTHGAAAFQAPLVAYRQYMINHETGHRLGRGHELCPGPGEPAPVMQQQSLGLHGCTPYPWPYLNSTRYKGRLGQYDDPIPSG